jgi:hypothetical protein
MSPIVDAVAPAGVLSGVHYARYFYLRFRGSLMTTTALRAWAMAGLVFLGVTAVAGAWPLLKDPSGELLKMPLSLLQHTPFHSYLIPGIVLLVCNGLLSFLVLLFTMRRIKNYGSWIVIQGIVLAIWLLTEIAWIRLIFWAQGVYFAVAAFLILAGWALSGRRSELDA